MSEMVFHDNYLILWITHLAYFHAFSNNHVFSLGVWQTARKAHKLKRFRCVMIVIFYSIFMFWQVFTYCRKHIRWSRQIWFIRFRSTHGKIWVTGEQFDKLAKIPNLYVETYRKLMFKAVPLSPYELMY